MTIQLQLPGAWPRHATWPDPVDQLRQLEQDKLDAKYEIRQVLDRYLLSDSFYEKEEALKAEIEEDIERENQRPPSGAP